MKTNRLESVGAGTVPPSTCKDNRSAVNKRILIKTRTGMGGCDSALCSAQTSLQTLQAETKKKKKKCAAIQRKGLYFVRGKPNESVGLGSPGQLAGGNEMKQSRGRKKTGWQSGDVTSGLN